MFLPPQNADVAPCGAEFFRAAAGAKYFSEKATYAQTTLTYLCAYSKHSHATTYLKYVRERRAESLRVAKLACGADVDDFENEFLAIEQDPVSMAMADSSDED